MMKKEDALRAIEYAKNPKNAVFTKTLNTEIQVRPNHEDIDNPNVWEDMHWNWFFDVYLTSQIM